MKKNKGSKGPAKKQAPVNPTPSSKKEEKSSSSGYKDLATLGEISFPGGKKEIHVRVVRRESDKEIYADVRTHVISDKFTGPTGKGITLDQPEQIDELIDLLEEAKTSLAGFKKKSSGKPAKK